MSTMYSQTNGAAMAGGGGGRQPQFRRQGSSYGPGHVHPNAVMVAPIRIDYSLQKGGLRSWLVLIMFVLLVSTILSIFSNPAEEEGAAVGEEGATTGYDGGDHEEKKESVPIDVEYSVKGVDEEVGVEPEEDEDEEEEEVSKEEALLASLREKAAQVEESRRKQQSSKREAPKKEEPVPSPPPPPPPQQQRVRRKKKPVVVEEPVVEEEGEEEGEEEEVVCPPKPVAKKAPPPPPQPPPQRRKPREPLHRRHASWRLSIQAQQLAAEDNKAPRRGILKHAKPSTVEVEGEDEMEQEEYQEQEAEDDPSINEVPLEDPLEDPIHEVVAVRKRTANYDRKAITNRDDYPHRKVLDAADLLSEKHDFDAALGAYDRVLSLYRGSPRAHYGRGRVFQLRSEFEADRQAENIDAAIAEYGAILQEEEESGAVPEELFKMAAHQLITCARFKGDLHKVLQVQRALIDKYSDELHYQNEFGITFLMMGRGEEAKSIFRTVMDIDPSNALAHAYYGYILKAFESDYEGGVSHMRRALTSSGGGDKMLDSRFYFHLGEALTRLGRSREASAVYEEAVEAGIFPSVMQRSIHNLDGLRAAPWWSADQSGCGKQLRQIERQWTVIREEAAEAWTNYGEEEFEEEGKHMSSGKQSALHLRRGDVWDEDNCRRLMPSTCELLKQTMADTSCFKDDVRVVALNAGSRLWPHCSATNYELHAHLGLVTPSEARIRVGGKETRGWRAGKFLLFDPSFETEIWFEGGTQSQAVRLILSIHLWHPQVPKSSRMSDEGEE